MVPNIARDASINRNMAVLCQELFELPDVTLTSSLYHSTSPVWLLGFCQAMHPCPQTNSFILWFTSLSWIRPDLRLIFALAAGLETRRLDSRPLPQSRPDDRMAKENRWQLRKTHRPLEAKNPHRRKFSRSLRSRLSSWS